MPTRREDGLETEVTSLWSPTNRLPPPPARTDCGIVIRQTLLVRGCVGVTTISSLANAEGAVDRPDGFETQRMRRSVPTAPPAAFESSGDRFELFELRLASGERLASRARNTNLARSRTSVAGCSTTSSSQRQAFAEFSLVARKTVRCGLDLRLDMRGLDEARGMEVFERSVHEWSVNGPHFRRLLGPELAGRRSP
jgi:hypothetical protein